MYTVELYKKDLRAKSGERLEHVLHGLGALGSPRQAIALNYQQQYPSPKYRVVVRSEDTEACGCYGCATMRHSCVRDMR